MHDDPVRAAFALPPDEAARIQAEVAEAMQVTGGGKPGAETPRELIMRLLAERGELTAGDMAALCGWQYDLGHLRCVANRLVDRGLLEVDTVGGAMIYRLAGRQT